MSRTFERQDAPFPSDRSTSDHSDIPAPPLHTPFMRRHIRAAADHLRNDSEQLRQCSPEQQLYHHYIDAGEPHGPPLYAVKGEHWNGVCPGFLDFINQFTFRPEDMGYAECGYGIQRHRDFLHRLILAEHDLHSLLQGFAGRIDVGCLAMTTRMAMYDLAKVAYRQFKARWPEAAPVALVPTPSWDYRGIFKDVGFEVVYLPIRPQHGWRPNLSEWKDIIGDLRGLQSRRIALAVSNPQHNPTGMQWPTEVTEHLLQVCAEESAYLLLDDAYFNVHDPRTPIVNHLKALLQAFDQNGGDNTLVRSGMFERWVSTRPFGKQFSCNTMGVAAITTSPLLLRQLARESWINRYHCNTHNAEVMCAWLATQDAADWTVETGLQYARQKEHVKQFLVTQLGWPQEEICIGPSTSYMIFAVPEVYQKEPAGIDRFRDDLFYATGTMLCASLFNQQAPAPYVRLHLGSHPDIIDEILRRWSTGGLHYRQKGPFAGQEALKTPLPQQRFRTQAES
ncbi:aminotransferase class I/II-fold pyridoxal phosphate-dependent enzyme [Hahella sp. CR1]|uniref:aminotransferase class I/II-fold pyridoxal phosphate-dependent enzyme n=1 Tax=Hahella sp. CR1 TaxID=2992807 RepID=UPI002442F522|nr:aminotransferase class I/II-fold pyridoxal phosphate-dependent enzyme [Hahella sp. CR1]MDG9667811.1 aminotransferase class I/II-fold pyridoxal phosphate-dependent enzyme [Hahella sp. CR1]